MSENSVNLAEETLLRIKQLEVKFAHFEADTRMTDCCLSWKRTGLAWKS